MCFPMNFAKFLRTPFFTEHLWWLLLKICCGRKVEAVKSKKLKVFMVKYFNISKIYSVNGQSKCSVQLTCRIFIIFIFGFKSSILHKLKNTLTVV